MKIRPVLTSPPKGMPVAQPINNKPVPRDKKTCVTKPPEGHLGNNVDVVA